MEPSPVIDNQFEDVTVAEVKGDSFTRSDGWSFFMPKDSPVKPKVGQRARFYGKGIGYPVRGLFLDGKEVFYRTELEEKKRHEKQVAESQAKKRADFEAKRAEHDARIAALPEAFRQRIAKFQASGPDWRWEFEPYELFCCEEAVRLAEHAGNCPPTTTMAEWLSAFVKATADVQRKLAPDMKIEEHSGNTFGCTVMLARLYLGDDPTLVIDAHGALAPLVGCQEYGCHRKAQP